MVGTLINDEWQPIFRSLYNSPRTNALWKSSRLKRCASSLSISKLRAERHSRLTCCLDSLHIPQFAKPTIKHKRTKWQDGGH